MNSSTRARMFGAVILVSVFAAGAMSGIAYSRIRPPGVNVNVKMVSRAELPRELRDLDPTKAQEDSLQAILRAGQQRTMRVLNDFEPRLRQAVDSMDAEIHAVLTPEQRVKFDATRKRRVESNVDRVIDTVRK